MNSAHNALPVVISGSNLSHVWLEVLQRALHASRGVLAPLIININGFKSDGMPIEDGRIRAALDQFLKRNGDWSVEIVAFTIFPQRYLQVCGGDRGKLYELYEDALPHIKATNPKVNGRGLYFERMIKFGAGKYNENQLEFAIQEYLAGRGRTSKYQISIYDPTRDQSREPYQSFPCLHSVSFVPQENGLVINAFYAMQYLVRKAYGNFLGLSHLGAFVASAMGLPLVQLNIMAGVERLEFPKKDLAWLIDASSNVLEDVSAL